MKTFVLSWSTSFFFFLVSSISSFFSCKCYSNISQNRRSYKVLEKPMKFFCFLYIFFFTKKSLSHRRGEFGVHNPSTGAWNQNHFLAHSVLLSLAVF